MSAKSSKPSSFVQSRSLSFHAVRLFQIFPCCSSARSTHAQLQSEVKLVVKNDRTIVFSGQRTGTRSAKSRATSRKSCTEVAARTDERLQCELICGHQQCGDSANHASHSAAPAASSSRQVLEFLFDNLSSRFRFGCFRCRCRFLCICRLLLLSHCVRIALLLLRRLARRRLGRLGILGGASLSASAIDLALIAAWSTQERGEQQSECEHS